MWLHTEPETGHQNSSSYRLACNDPVLELMIDLLIQQDQAEHGPAQTPLVGAVLKEDDLKQGGQGLR